MYKSSWLRQLSGSSEDASWQDLHEDSGEHTCDLRSSRTTLHQEFPWIHFENGFTEEDPLWTADHRETDAEHDIRTRRALDRFMKANGTCMYLSQQRQIAGALITMCRHFHYVSFWDNGLHLPSHRPSSIQSRAWWGCPRVNQGDTAPDCM